MEELEYRVVFKDGTLGNWHTRHYSEVGSTFLERIRLNSEVVQMEVRTSEPHCSLCELAVEDLGLCFEHLNEELDTADWPDFYDEP